MFFSQVSEAPALDNEAQMHLLVIRNSDLQNPWIFDQSAPMVVVESHGTPGIAHTFIPDVIDVPSTGIFSDSSAQPNLYSRTQKATRSSGWSVENSTNGFRVRKWSTPLLFRSAPRTQTVILEF